jgi:hypothetical protein
MYFTKKSTTGILTPILGVNILLANSKNFFRASKVAHWHCPIPRAIIPPVREY